MKKSAEIFAYTKYSPYLCPRKLRKAHQGHGLRSQPWKRIRSSSGTFKKRFFDIMQHTTGADIWTSPACRCKPSKPSRVCEIGARLSATDKRQQGCSQDKPREPSGYREKPPRTGGQKFRNSNAGKALFNGIIYRANVYIMLVELILDIFKIGNHYWSFRKLLYSSDLYLLRNKVNTGLDDVIYIALILWFSICWI